MSCLHQPIAPAWADAHAPCAVIDIQAEMVFWADTYASQPFHRPGTPLRHYVPTLKFAYDVYLLSHRQSLQELLPSLPARYHVGVVRGVRLDWPLAQAVIERVWQRLNAPLEDDPPLFAPSPAAWMDERAILAAAMRQR